MVCARRVLPRVAIARRVGRQQVHQHNVDRVVVVADARRRAHGRPEGRVHRVVGRVVPRLVGGRPPGGLDAAVGFQRDVLQPLVEAARVRVAVDDVRNVARHRFVAHPLLHVQPERWIAAGHPHGRVGRHRLAARQRRARGIGDGRRFNVVARRTQLDLGPRVLPRILAIGVLREARAGPVLVVPWRPRWRAWRRRRKRWRRAGRRRWRQRAGWRTRILEGRPTLLVARRWWRWRRWWARRDANLVGILQLAPQAL